MKKTSVGAALALTLISCAQVERQEPVGKTSTAIEVEEPANREVVLAETPAGRPFHFMPVDEEEVGYITMIFAWPTRWAYEARNNPATPYVAAEVIPLGGTAELAPRQVQENAKDQNAKGALSVRADYVIGELGFPRRHIELVLPTVNEMLSAPQFDPAWVERIKHGFRADQKQSQTQTTHRMWAAARIAVLGDGPLNDSLSLPDLDAIDKVDVDDLRRWHRETIVGSGATIAVAGAISLKEAGRAIDRLLAGLPNGKDRSAPVIEADFSPKTIFLHLPDAEKTTLVFLGRLPPTAEGDDLIDFLALDIFARPGSGPLFDAVRTDLRASYGFGAGYTNYDRATRLMFIEGEVESAKLAQAAELVLRRYEDYRTRPDLTALDIRRQEMADETKRRIWYVDVVARTILEMALDERDTGDAPRLDELLANIRASDIEDRLSTAFPPGEDLIVVAAGPDADALPGACVITKIEQALGCPSSRFGSL